MYSQTAESLGNDTLLETGESQRNYNQNGGGGNITSPSDDKAISIGSRIIHGLIGGVIAGTITFLIVAAAVDFCPTCIELYASPIASAVALITLVGFLLDDGRRDAISDDGTNVRERQYNSPGFFGIHFSGGPMRGGRGRREHFGNNAPYYPDHHRHHGGSHNNTNIRGGGGGGYHHH